MKKKKYLYGIGVVSFAVLLFLTMSLSYASVEQELIFSNSATLTPTAEATPQSLATPEPTFTPIPIITPTSTSTPTPTPTPDPCYKMDAMVTSYALMTKTFTETDPDIGTIAVDPEVIPLGSEIFVPGYGFGLALDIGGAVLGAHVDIWLPTRQKALIWGVKYLEITVCPGSLNN